MFKNFQSRQFNKILSIVVTVSIEYTEQVIQHWVKIKFRNVKYIISNHFSVSNQCSIHILHKNIGIPLVICTNKIYLYNLGIRDNYLQQVFLIVSNGGKTRKKRKIRFYYVYMLGKVSLWSRNWWRKGRISFSKNFLKFLRYFCAQDVAGKIRDTAFKISMENFWRALKLSAL